VATLAEKLDALSVTASLAGTEENPLGGTWTKLGGTNNVGKKTTTGWITTTVSTTAGAVWTGSYTSDKQLAMVITVPVLPGVAGQLFEWGFEPNEFHCYIERVSSTKCTWGVVANNGFIGTGETTWAAADRWAFAYEAGKVFMLRKPSAGVWTVVKEATTTAPSAVETPYILFGPGGSSNVVARLTNFTIGSLVETKTVEGKASLTGTGSLAATGQRTRIAKAPLTGTGSLTTKATRTRIAAGSLTGTGTLSAKGIRVRTAAASLSGTGSLSAKLVRVKVVKAALSGTGSLTASASTLHPPAPRASKPPLALSVEVETPHGIFRLAGDSTDPHSIPQGLSFSTQRGDGFGPASVTLTRPIFHDYPDLNLLDTWRFVGDQGEVAWEGRLHSMPRTNSSQQQIEPTLVGWMTYLTSKRISPLIIDSRLGGWGEPSAERKAAILAGAKQRLNVQVGTGWQDTGEAAPGITFSWTSITTVSEYADRGEAWFFSSGEDIGALLYHFKNLVGAGNESFWETVAFLSPSDFDLTTDRDKGVEHDGFTNSSAYETLEATKEGRVYAVVKAARTEKSTPTNLPDFQSWELPKVVGNHGLDLHGTWPEVGFYISDILGYVIETYYPKLNWAGEANSFPVRQASWHDSPASGYEIMQQLNNLVLWETSVWENRTVYFEAADLTKFDWLINTSDPGVSVSLQGDSIEAFANGVTVAYQDFSGIQRTLYPTDHAELRDDSENNPANAHEEDLWAETSVSWPCTEEEALQTGRTYLAEYNRPKRPGSFQVAGHIRDGAGNWQQGWKVRSSETVGIVNDLGELEPRLIFATSWDHESRTLDITTDAPPKYLDAIVARQGVEREVRALG
jgi:hypothetical protein